MSRLKKGDVVKLDPSILEDESRKRSHFFFKHIIDEDLTGEVVGQGETINLKGVWVKFHYGKVLADEKYLLETCYAW